MTDPLLMDWDDRLPWKRTAGAITATEILRGSDETGLVVVLGTSASKPTRTDMRALFHARAGGGISPILVAVTYPGSGQQQVSLLGLDEDSVQVDDIEVALAEQLLKDALTASSPTGLHTEVARRLGTLFSGLASGLRNEGLFATHALEHKPEEPGWGQLCERSAPLLSKRGTVLLAGLGYTVENVPDGTVLRETAGGHRRAAAVLLADGESFENPLNRLHNTTAVTHGLNLARKENLDWLVVLGGPVVRLYPVSPDVGVGRKGQTQTYVELDLSLLTGDRSGFLALLFSPESLATDGAVAGLLDESSKYAAGLSERLRDRIYVDVVPALAVAVAEARGVASLPEQDRKAGLDEAYHQTMILLFRLLFVAYGEDRGLLPYGKSERYTRNALKTLALDLVHNPDQGFSGTATTLWDDLTQVWKVIDTGDVEGWGVPAYNGGLFTRDAQKNQSGADTYDLDLTNAQVGPALRGLLVDVTPEGPGPVDFRSLSVREFGTIYEGLLESGLGVADTDLTLDSAETYVPAGPGDNVKVPAGRVYFHSRSGSRKASGSYFTKPFAVEHLLDSALEAALDKHLDKVEALLRNGATKSAALALFDFRVADLAMGSAHFLVAAVDRIEARFSAFLADHPLPEIAVELHELRQAALGRLTTLGGDSSLDDGMLLRRQIARRCIYGIDINELAVELARLAIWIHTFVPGLPLSFLNHGLVQGNSLTGMGTLAEIAQSAAKAEAAEHGTSATGLLFDLPAVLEQFMSAVRPLLDELGSLSDASVADVGVAGDVQQRVVDALEPLSDLCDLLTAERATRYLGKQSELAPVYDRNGRPQVDAQGKPQWKKISVPHEDRVLIGAGNLFNATNAEDLSRAITGHPHLARARALARQVQATHLPVAYPEVFSRENPGFDVVLGNPPWKEITVEELQFWTLRFPGMKRLANTDQTTRIRDLRDQRPDLVQEFHEAQQVAAQTRRVLIAGPYEGIGEGDPDVYKAFAWRILHSQRGGGHAGVLVPRSIWTTKGSSAWRQALLKTSSVVVDLARNENEWLFDDVNVGYQITLVSWARDGGATLGLRGEFRSLDQFHNGTRLAPITLTAEQVESVDPLMCVPSLNDADAIRLYQILTKQPPLSDGRLKPWRPDFRAAPATEIHATNDGKARGIFTNNPDDHPVYNHLNIDAFRFNPAAGVFNHADLSLTLSWLQTGRVATHRRVDSAYSVRPAEWAMDPTTLPTANPRLAFRDVVHATNQRKIWFALLPPHTLLTNSAPYLVFQDDDVERDAFLLGVLNSGVVDWFGHLRIGLHLNYFILYTLPVPLWDRHHPLAREVTELAAALAVQPGYSFGGAWTALSRLRGSVDASDARARLDAAVSLLYGIPDDLMPLIFPPTNSTRSPFELVCAHRRELEAAL
ncbi:MAG: hypothetical protein NVSMB55_00620 [Mycobacteriales bacterium]